MKELFENVCAEAFEDFGTNYGIDGFCKYDEKEGICTLLVKKSYYDYTKEVWEKIFQDDYIWSYSNQEDTSIEEDKFISNLKITISLNPLKWCDGMELKIQIHM